MDYKTLMGGLVLVAVLFIWYKLAKSGLKIAYALSSDGVKVSLTKVLQLIGGLTGTYLILTMPPNETMFGLYLAYVAGVEGFSKYVKARYNYNESNYGQPYTPYRQPYRRNPEDERLAGGAQKTPE